jgi:hypothetical protein
MNNEEGIVNNGPPFTEEKLLNSVRKLLAGRVNGLLEEMEYPIPPIEFGNYRGGSAVVPVISLTACERSEKERIIRLDAYTLTITFTVAECVVLTLNLPFFRQAYKVYQGLVA